ncbi:MAG: hypothetical protein N2109_10135 [Fimbriimonadales bacterium]|nr:hypothetical protein [Fimbriimonadales bacterium]
MVYCSCGKPIEKIPSWMQRVRVEFVCNNCPNRKHLNITAVDLSRVIQSTANQEAPEDLEAIPDDDADLD